jgi:hypothetical protein
MRLVDGEIQIIPYGNSMKSDCNMGASSTEWKAIMPDGTLVAPGTAGTLKYNTANGTVQIATAVATAASTNIDIKSLAAAAGVNVPQILIAAGLAKESSAAYAGDRLYVDATGERLPLRGSGFGYASNSGVAAVDLGNPRSGAGSYISFRSAFIE